MITDTELRRRYGLKDRKGCALSFDELAHYPRIIAALVETRRLMSEVDAAIEAAGGLPMK